MIETQHAWGLLVAIYLFLGGLSAGAILTSCILELFAGGRFKTTINIGAWIGVVALGLGLLSLVAETGQPFRAIVLFNSFVNFSSWMTIGAWLLFFALMVFGLFAILKTEWLTVRLSNIWKPLKKIAPIAVRILAVIGIPVSLGVAIYTGILLGVLEFIPLWNTWLLPLLFTVSAIDTGMAAVSG